MIQLPISELRTAWEMNVGLFACPAVWTQGGNVYSLGVGYSVARDTDPAIVNALGAGVRMITIRAIDTAGREPRPFDRLDVGSESLTIDYVTPVLLIGATVGWRCYCAGGRPGP